MKMETENLNLDTMQAADHLCSRNVEDKSQVEICSIRNETICNVLSKIYAQVLISITVTALFTEVLHGPVPLFHIHVYFYFYLLGVSILIFVSSYLSRFIHKLNGENVHLEIWENNNNHIYLNKYFLVGLLVCGLAAFSGTFLRSFASFISTTCIKSTSSVLYALHFAFIILQLPFLCCAKRFNFVFGGFHKIGIMHLIATNASLWLYILLWESSKDWQEILHLKHNSSLKWGQKDINITLHSLESDINTLNQSYPKHVVHVTSNCWWRVVSESEFSEDILSVQLCLENSSVGMVWKKVSDCLYPLHIQYYLIVLFLLYAMWKNLTLKCKRQCSLSSNKSHNTNHCFFLSKGFYLGCIYVSASIIIVILYFIFDIPNFDAVVMSMLIIIFASATFAVLISLCQMNSAITCINSLNQSSIHFQEIGVYFVYVYGSSNLLVGCLSDKKYILLLIFEALLMILHAVSQYLFIKSKIKVRQVINFLILCNVSLWILESSMFCFKTPAQMQLKVYGVAWPVMSRIIVPCLAFYRFHSAIVFFNMSRLLSVELH